MTLFYSDGFILPLPAHHRFPMAKYARLRSRLLDSGEFEERDFRVPDAASDAEITRVHCADYLRRVATGAMSPQEIRAIGFPWSERMVERSRRSSGATLAAAREALSRGWSANLAGGTHHAFRDRGEGFCVFNDAAIAARAMQAEAGLQRVAIIDCDVHQGNGTAAIFAGDDSVFTFSIHGARNFPFAKEASDLDIELADGTGDHEYLWHLERGLDETLERSRPQLAFYLAGADPYEGDRLGRLALTQAGLARRDDLVLRTLAARGVPVALAMAGGYARDIEDSVAIHARSIVAARRVFAG
ncbi:MAG TPA: histone deacetylase [Usitatibacter sp.]|nr:histone deacetylase [Usitatibacter sp.]